MPIYEYECPKCGAHMERLVRAEGDIPKKCPECGSTKLHKAFSAFSVAAGGAPAHEPSSACASCPSGSCPYSGGGE